MKKETHALSQLQAWGVSRHSVKFWIGLAIFIVGLIAISHHLYVYMQSNPVVWQALMGGSAAALATALGTLPVLFSQRMSQRTQDTLYGFGAGVMLAACAFSLIIPGLTIVQEEQMWGGTPWAASAIVGMAIILGALALLGLDRALPHEHFIKGREGLDIQAVSTLRRTWLFVIAITLHNLPEGLAIGVAYAGSEGMRANAVAVGISIQDVPEGLVVAVALVSAGYSRLFAVLLGMASGLVEPLGAVIGAAAVSSSASLLPWGLGFAAGAMLFVISHEIIPESHRKGHETFATGGLILGFVMMMVLDTSLG